MEREKITREVLATALRRLRTTCGLTQKELAARAADFKELGLGCLLESQISDFERGRALPSLGSLLNLLAGCSESGSRVDFTKLQRVIESVALEEGEALARRMPELSQEAAAEMVEQVFADLSARMVDRLQGEMQYQRDEMAELRTRVVRTERLLASVAGVGREPFGASWRGAKADLP